LRYLKWAIFAVFSVGPAATLILPQNSSVAFHLLLLCALIAIACRLRPIGLTLGSTLGQTIRAYWPLCVAMAGLSIAVLLQQLAYGELLFSAYDKPSRLAFFPLLFWLFLLFPSKDLKSVQWGLVTGVFVCTVFLFVETDGGALRPMNILAVPLIPFGNMVLLMGVLCLLSMGLNDRTEKLIMGLKMLAGLAALYASYLTQARGGWIALPLFIAIAFMGLRHMRLSRKLAILAIFLSLICGSFMFSKMVQDRVNAAKSDIRLYVSGESVDTSLGIRFQLWRASWLMFKDSPAVGVGREQYPKAIKDLESRHVISAVAASFPHSHNDILFSMAILGIFGALAMLSLYFVPAFYFLREIRNPDRELRTVAGMGAAVTLGFFVFGLTDAMFFWTQSFTIYGTLLPPLFAYMLRREEILSSREKEVRPGDPAGVGIAGSISPFRTTPQTPA
jgi:O-antigen ligase